MRAAAMLGLTGRGDRLLRAAGEASRGGGAVLFGRESELAALEAFAAGEGSLVFVEGHAGIGKTTLVSVACSRLRGRGVRVLWACGQELEREFEFGIVRQLFERVLTGASREQRGWLLAGPAALADVAVGSAEIVDATVAAARDSVFPLVHALYWLTANLAESGPLVLVVDDAHWADSSSLRFLAYLAARVEGLGVRIVVAARPSAPEAAPSTGDDDLLARLRAGAGAGAGVLRLPGLGSAATAAIMAERFGSQPDPRLVAACLRASGGNPFLLGELAEALRRDGVAPDAAAAELVAALGPDTVARSVLLRVSRLPASAAPVARAIAVLDAHAELRWVGAVTGLSAWEVEQAADGLAAVNVLAAEPPLRFVHPIVREAIYGELPPGTRGRLHARVARVLMGEGQDPTLVASHVLLAAPAGDQQAVELLRQGAAVAVGRGAVELGQRLLERALAEPPSAESRADVLAELGLAQALAGRELEAASAHLDEAAVATADRALRVARVEAAARVRLYLGDFLGAAERLGRARVALPAGERATRLRLLAHEAAVGVLAPPVARAALAALEQHADVGGADAAELAVLAELAGRRWLDGRIGEAVGLAERALAGDRLLTAEGPASVALNHALAVLIDGDRFDLAEPTLTRAIALAREQGSLLALSSLVGVQLVAAWRSGDLPEVETLSRGMLDLLEASESLIAVPSLWAALGGVLIERGELDAAEQALARSGVGPGLPKLTFLGLPFLVRARLRLAQARPGEALADLLELRGREQQLGVAHLRDPWRREAVQAALLVGERDLARELVEEQLTLTRRWDLASARGIALSTQALVDGGRNGLELLEQAAALLARSPARLDHARSLFDLGCALRRVGRRGQARDALAHAVELAQRCGAQTLARRASDELAAAGARPPRHQHSGLEALTGAERRVARLAARGQSNRQIAAALYVSVRTVENHLARSYGKLGIASRTELAGITGLGD